MKNPGQKWPGHPLSRGYIPPHYRTKVQVTDQGNWESIAARFDVRTQRLIYFNFAIPDEVDFHAQDTKMIINYYLKHLVGCDKTRDDKNWAFSSSANPGIVYIPLIDIPYPQTRVNFRPRPSRLPNLVKHFKNWGDTGRPLQTASLILDSATLVDIGLTLFRGLGLNPIAGAILSAAGPFVMLGGAHEAAINEILKEERLSGLSLGIVLGADRRKPQYVYENFLNNYYNYNTRYPNYRERFANEYKRALAAGYAIGLEFDDESRVNFFAHLYANMKPHPRDEWGPLSGWSHRDWISYYVSIAATLRRLHLR